jgi:hypothetical protein
MSMKQVKERMVLCWFVAMAAALVLGLANLYLGDLNQDEGWYLYAGKQVAAGRMLYRDFAFTQAPMLPMVYSLVNPLVDRFGVAGGRFFTMVLGLLAAGFSAFAAARMVPHGWRRHAALAAFALVAVNVYQSYFTTVVKTYALCALFLAAAAWLLTMAASRRGMWACFAGGMLLALAAGTRISAGAALPVVFIGLVWQYRLKGWLRWFLFGAGGGLTLLAVFLPFLVGATDGFVFGVLQYHTFREAGSAVYQAVLKAGFISRFVQAYFVATLLVLMMILWRWLAGREPGHRVLPERVPATGFCWAIGLAISLVHFSAPFPYDDYQVVVVPVLGAALAAGLVRWMYCRMPGADPNSPATRWIMWSVVLVCAAAAFSSPINQAWMIRGRDRIWWKTKDKPDLVLLQEVGQWLRERNPPDAVLLTQDTYVAVEAGLRVPEGMELGPFSYYPDWSDEKAEKLRVMNKTMLEQCIEQARCPFAAISGYGLTIRSPEVSELTLEERQNLQHELDRYYEAVRTVPHFGQAHTPLELFKRKDSEL